MHTSNSYGKYSFNFLRFLLVSSIIYSILKYLFWLFLLHNLNAILKFTTKFLNPWQVSHI